MTNLFIYAKNNCFTYNSNLLPGGNHARKDHQSSPDLVQFGPDLRPDHDQSRCQSPGCDHARAWYHAQSLAATTYSLSGCVGAEHRPATNTPSHQPRLGGRNAQYPNDRPISCRISGEKAHHRQGHAVARARQRRCHHLDQGSGHVLRRPDSSDAFSPRLHNRRRRRIRQNRVRTQGAQHRHGLRSRGRAARFPGRRRDASQQWLAFQHPLLQSLGAFLFKKIP